jgi:hypothetical protein
MIVRREVLNAALAATTADDSRYFLTSIRLEPEHNRAVATDGHILLMLTDSHPFADQDFPQIAGADFNETEPTPPFCLPANIAKNMIGALPKKSTIPILCCIRAGRNGDPNKVTIAATDLEASRTAVLHDVIETAQRFPAYDRVIPKDDRPELAVILAVDVLDHLLKAAKAIGARTIRFGLPLAAKDRETIKIPGKDAIEAKAATETEPATEAQPAIPASTKAGDVNTAVRITMKNDGITITGAAMPCRL